MKVFLLYIFLISDFIFFFWYFYYLNWAINFFLLKKTLKVTKIYCHYKIYFAERKQNSITWWKKIRLICFVNTLTYQDDEQSICFFKVKQNLWNKPLFIKNFLLMFELLNRCQAIGLSLSACTPTMPIF